MKCSCKSLFSSLISGLRQENGTFSLVSLFTATFYPSRSRQAVERHEASLSRRTQWFWQTWTHTETEADGWIRLEDDEQRDLHVHICKKTQRRKSLTIHYIYIKKCNWKPCFKITLNHKTDVKHLTSLNVTAQLTGNVPTKLHNIQSSPAFNNVLKHSWTLNVTNCSENIHNNWRMIK